VHTAFWSQSFWLAGRPGIAWPLWRTLVALSDYDSPGHIHEVLRGDAPIPQAQSVPEQNWSSAAFFTATMRGLLGLSANALDGQLTFAPHLATAKWPALTISNLRLGNRVITLQLASAANSLRFAITNSGPAFCLQFTPELPDNASGFTAALNQAPVQIAAGLITATIPSGTSILELHFHPAN
jgi:hypothetical protein